MGRHRLNTADQGIFQKVEPRAPRMIIQETPTTRRQKDYRLAGDVIYTLITHVVASPAMGRERQHAGGLAQINSKPERRAQNAGQTDGAHCQGRDVIAELARELSPGMHKLKIADDVTRLENPSQFVDA